MLDSDDDIFRSIVVIEDNDENFLRIQEMLNDNTSPRSRMQSYKSERPKAVL